VLGRNTLPSSLTAISGICTVKKERTRKSNLVSRMVLTIELLQLCEQSLWNAIFANMWASLKISLVNSLHVDHCLTAMCPKILSDETTHFYSHVFPIEISYLQWPKAPTAASNAASKRDPSASKQ
jgi:hypothetical protein